MAKLQGIEGVFKECIVPFADLRPYVPEAPQKRAYRPNAGHFKTGFDPRRHIFTQQEIMAGYEAALEKMGACSDFEARRRLRKVMRKTEAARDERRHASASEAVNVVSQ
jgi:hypothetical protein